MNQESMASLIADSLGGKVNDNGEIEAKDVTITDANGLIDTPTSDAGQPQIEPPKTTNNEPDGKIINDTPNGKQEDNSSLKSFDDLLAEKSNGKFKSWEEIESLSNPKTEFANDLVSKLNDFAKKFEDPNMALDLFLKTQTTDFNQLSAEDAVKMKIRMDNPELTEKEIDYEFKSTYKLDEGEYDEDTVELAKLKLEREAKKAKSELTQLQQEIAVNGDKDPAQLAEAQKQYEENKNNWYKQSEQAIKSLDKLSFKINENENFDWQFDDKDKNEALNITKELYESSANFFKMFQDDKGNYDQAKIASAYLKLKKFDDIVGAAVERALNTAKDGMLREMKNSSFKPANNGGAQNTPQSIEEQIAAQWINKM
jgi:hypothetical protein